MRGRHSRKEEELGGRLRAGLSVRELVGLDGFIEAFGESRVHRALLAGRADLDSALAVCASHWLAPAPGPEGWRCGLELAGGPHYVEWQLCLGRSSKSRCREDFELSRRFFAQQAVSRAQDSPARTLVRRRCGYYDREAAAGAVSFGLWLECMLPVCSKEAEVAVDCFEHSGLTTGATQACSEPALNLVRCAMAENDIMFAIEMRDKVRALALEPIRDTEYLG